MLKNLVFNSSLQTLQQTTQSGHDASIIENPLKKTPPLQNGCTLAKDNHKDQDTNIEKTSPTSSEDSGYAMENVQSEPSEMQQENKLFVALFENPHSEANELVGISVAKEENDGAETLDMTDVGDISITVNKLTEDSADTNLNGDMSSIP